MADSGYESLANYRWLFENGQTAFIKPANYESGKSVLQSHRLAEWKTWAITNRMTALSARMADIWISVLTIPPMRRTVQSAKSLFTAARTAPAALTVQPAARLKTAKSAKKFCLLGISESAQEFVSQHYHRGRKAAALQPFHSGRGCLRTAKAQSEFQAFPYRR